jgi:hypothetical protein
MLHAGQHDVSRVDGKSRERFRSKASCFPDPVLRPAVVAPIGTQTKGRLKARLLGCDQAMRSVARKPTPQQGYNLGQNGRPLILAQQYRLIERKTPSQQTQQKDRFAKACPNARHVQGVVQYVHTGSPEKRISKFASQQTAYQRGGSRKDRDTPWRPQGQAASGTGGLINITEERLARSAAWQPDC